MISRMYLHSHSIMIKRYFFVFVILVLLVSTYAQNVRVLNELEIANLREKTLRFTEPIKIGDRTFIPQSSSEGFVSIADDNVFIVQNAEIKTPEISIKIQDQTTVFFNDVKNINIGNNKYIQIYDENNYKTININGKKFSIKKDAQNVSQLVLGKNGDLIEAHFSADKRQLYEIQNLKFDVPKDAKVDYKDGLIVVTVPERSTIKKPGLIDPGKYAGVNLKYVSENGKPMLIEDGNKKFSLEGTVENYNKDIYIFSDGDKHRHFGHAYFSYNGDKKISFGVPAGHKGMYVILREGNPIVPITNGQTALRAFGADAKWPVGVTRQSHISIENRDTLSNPPLVSTEGPFMIKNGNLYYAYEPYLNPEVPQFWNLDDHQQSAYLEIASRNHEGKIIEYTILDSGKQISKTLTKNLYMNNDNGAVFLDPADVSKNKNLIKLASLTQPERAIISTLMTLPPDKQQQILGSDVNGFLGQDIEKIRKKIQAVDLKQITGAGTSTPPQTPQTPKI